MLTVEHDTYNRREVVELDFVPGENVMDYPAAEAIDLILPEVSNVEFVAHGGQKAVYKCMIGQSTYALKVVPMEKEPRRGSNGTHASEIRARVDREVACMKECASPFVVRIGPLDTREFDIEARRFLCFAEEYIEGKTLRSVLQDEGAMPFEDLVRMALNVSSGLAELWGHRKIHRDVKPDNIMKRNSDGNYVLLDMGLVLVLDATSLSRGPVGTLAYFAPEQMDFHNRRSVLGLRSDFFSLGVVMYEMATTKHPFLTKECLSPIDLLRRIRTYSPKSPRELGSYMPQELDTVIMRLIEKRPALRFRTLSQLHDALRSIEGG